MKIYKKYLLQPKPLILSGFGCFLCLKIYASTKESKSISCHFNYIKEKQKIKKNKKNFTFH
ncbi:hypothetical protein HMPREF1982_01825 [Clostridiales bacterium oral taxon 876 str. F0540]|nr:hypothetical protein HMPREF1982_01825 [Clostridiales bacterium oral taxon 876 str. F0540]